MMGFRSWAPLWAVGVHLGHQKAALHSDISCALCPVPAQAWAGAFPSAVLAHVGKRGSQHLGK